MELKHQNLYKLIECIIKKCHGVKQNAKKCAIGETECNETLSLRIYQKRKKGWGRGRRERGLRKGAERTEKRQKGAELTI